ncbi:MAG: hypothetical protein IPJ14_17105 [Kineosporiaceae bacterium]|nr:hypothetical protein [Kineosporiaceae bacterium]
MTNTVGGPPPGWAAMDAMVVGDALGGIPREHQLLVLGLMVGSALWAVVRPSGPAHLAFVACALMWSRANQAFEVAVLWTISAGHGLTVADLWPPLLALAIVGRRLAPSGVGLHRVSPPRPMSVRVAGQVAGAGSPRRRRSSAGGDPSDVGRRDPVGALGAAGRRPSHLDGLAGPRQGLGPDVGHLTR